MIIPLFLFYRMAQNSRRCICTFTSASYAIEGLTRFSVEMWVQNGLARWTASRGIALDCGGFRI